MRRITDAADWAEEEVVLSRIRAEHASCPELANEYRRIAERWKELGEAFREAERISGFIAWSSERVPAP